MGRARALRLILFTHWNNIAVKLSTFRLLAIVVLDDRSVESFDTSLRTVIVEVAVDENRAVLAGLNGFDFDGGMVINLSAGSDSDLIAGVSDVVCNAVGDFLGDRE